MHVHGSLAGAAWATWQLARRAAMGRPFSLPSGFGPASAFDSGGLTYGSALRSLTVTALNRAGPRSSRSGGGRHFTVIGTDATTFSHSSVSLPLLPPSLVSVIL